MRIGEAAELVGVPAHVLRHWEDRGVVTPGRAPGGHREYDAELVSRLRLVRRCQAAGLSLVEIRSVLDRHHEGRHEVLVRRLAEIEEQLEVLTLTRTFLRHVVHCRHDLVTECQDCAGFARTAG